MPRLIFSLLFLSLAKASAASGPDLNQPYFMKNAGSAFQIPSVFVDRTDPHAYHVLPIAYRVKLINGKPQLKVLTFATGKIRVQAALVPYPEKFTDHPKYQALIDEIREADPAAVFLYPVLKNGTVKFLGLSEGAETIDLIGAGGDPSGRNLLVMFKATSAKRWIVLIAARFVGGSKRGNRRYATLG